MSNEESDRITTSQDVISHLHDKIDEQQAEAMRLADECEESATHWVHEIDTRFKAAKMLRAQQARIAELEERLEIDYRHPYDGIAARDVTIKALDERIAELESQLDAIGAGGVEPLRKPAAQVLDAQTIKHISALSELVRMPNAEHFADAHNAAVRHLRAIAAKAKE